MYIFLLCYPRKASSHHQVIQRENLPYLQHRWLDLSSLAALWKLGQDVVTLMAVPRESLTAPSAGLRWKRTIDSLWFSEETFRKHVLSS